MEKSTTKAAARALSERLGRRVTPNLLHALIINDRLAPPAKNDYGFYVWTAADIEAAAAALAIDRRKKALRQAIVGGAS